ncbi:MAG TPA: type 4a pilus biogenesis protein PilO [Planctomycetota bacterium]|nr:type 4a pilus biogenesis protein PilO [Planctomycetota bacterium]
MSKDLRNTLIAVALFVAVLGVMIYSISNTQDQLDAVLKENSSIEEEIKANDDYCKKGPELKRQSDELDANFRDYVKILPSAEIATTEKLYNTIANDADAAQIHIEEVITSNKAAEGGGKLGEFQAVTLNFRIDADFDGFVRFLNQMERHEQFMKVNSFSVNPSANPRVVDGKEIIDLSITIEVATYKYIPTKK